MYDVTDKESFENIRQWMHEIERFASDSVNRCLVGNKSDLDNQREVSFEAGESLAKSFGIPFLETSAKSEKNVGATFNTIAKEILKRWGEKQQVHTERDSHTIYST